MGAYRDAQPEAGFGADESYLSKRGFQSCGNMSHHGYRNGYFQLTVRLVQAASATENL